MRKTFENIFRREHIEAALIEGDSFHRYDRDEMRRLIEAYEQMGGQAISHFGPEANLFEELGALFAEYSKRGGGNARLYLHNEERAARYGRKAGTFTPWEKLPEESFVVIRLSDAERLNVPYLLAMIDDSFVSRPDTIVVPGTRMEYAMQLILTPMIRDLVNESRKARG